MDDKLIRMDEWLKTSGRPKRATSEDFRGICQEVGEGILDAFATEGFSKGDPAEGDTEEEVALLTPTQLELAFYIGDNDEEESSRFNLLVSNVDFSILGPDAGRLYLQHEGLPKYESEYLAPRARELLDTLEVIFHRVATRVMQKHGLSVSSVEYFQVQFKRSYLRTEFDVAVWPLVEEINSLYWNEKKTIAQLEKAYGVKPLKHWIRGQYTGRDCVLCGEQTYYEHRQFLIQKKGQCSSCGHWERGSCECDTCETERIARAERLRREREEAAAKKRAEHQARCEARRAVVTGPGYAAAAAKILTRKQKEVLSAVIEVLDQGDFSWDKVCEIAGVVSHKSHFEKFIEVGLLYESPEGGYNLNETIDRESLAVEQNVRKISKGTRFDVFSRDEFTCKYCGRKAPDVELEVDHLIPVARGGTDEFSNLVTSCYDCNRGKSDKDIQQFTGGFTRDEWRDELRRRRAAVLEERRKRLPEVFDHWAKCRRAPQVSDYDAKFIYNFIEIYEPELIMRAIEVAVKSSPSNYGKYVAGVLRKLSEQETPEYQHLEAAKLEGRAATAKQVEFIRGLLRKLRMDLADVYFKTDYSDLTMLDAKNLIDELTRKNSTS